ncbi:hypothetical protein AAVH_12201 [Aphelenchoides avenae]|nr:hypothetical protein AAVH_12201 [Aphelenchus avenae]
MISKPRCVSKLILAGKETQAMLVQFLRRFKVAEFHNDIIFRLNNGEKFPWGDSHYILFEDFRHIFNFGGYKPAVKITGNQEPIANLLELKDICQLDLNEQLPPSADVVAKLNAQTSASLKRLTSIPNVKVQCFEYPFPRRGYTSAFFIRRIEAEEIIVRDVDLATSDVRPSAANTTVKRFRIQFDHVQGFDLPRLLQDLRSVYPNLEQLFLEHGLDHDDTTFVRQLQSDNDLNGILSSLQDLAAKTPFKISYERFKRFAKRGSIANLEYFIEFELEEKL